MYQGLMLNKKMDMKCIDNAKQVVFFLNMCFFCVFMKIFRPKTINISYALFEMLSLPGVAQDIGSFV